MTEKDDDATFHTSQEDSMRQAEAAFGGGSSDTVLPDLGSSPEPAAAPAPVPASAPPVRPTSGGLPPSGPPGAVGIPGAPRRRRSMAGRGIALVVVLGIIAAVGGGIFALVNSVSNTVDKVRSSPVFSVPSVPSVPGAPPPSQPGGGGSYFTFSGLRGAMAKAQALAGAGARIQLARIADDQLQVIARTGTRGRIVLVSSGLTRRIDTPSGTLTGNEFGFAAIRPAVVSRLTSALRRRFRVSANEIDYMVVIRDPIDKNLEWLVYPRGGGGHFQANATGGGLRRLG